MSSQGDHSTNTFVDEAFAFTDRHYHGLDTVQKSFGGLTFGTIRAIAECPDCPGHFRIPYDDAGNVAWPVGAGDWKYLRCPNCKGVWIFQG